MLPLCVPAWVVGMDDQFALSTCATALFTSQL
jgi:hypothetical protein